MMTLPALDNLTPRPDEAVGALLSLTREMTRQPDPAQQARCLSLGRRFATVEVVEALLDAAAGAEADPKALAAALRFRGAAVIGAVLGRLNDAADRDRRKAYFQLATALADFPELRDSLAGSLEAALYDRRGEVARNGIALLTAMGLPLPAESHRDLASSPDVQVRLALAQVLARSHGDPAALEALCALSRDEHPGVRRAAEAGLRGSEAATASRPLPPQ